jgi:hypothetical protein
VTKQGSITYYNFVNAATRRTVLQLLNESVAEMTLRPEGAVVLQLILPDSATIKLSGDQKDSQGHLRMWPIFWLKEECLYSTN